MLQIKHSLCIILQNCDEGNHSDEESVYNSEHFDGNAYKLIIKNVKHKL